jgi:predicted metal-dependent peptidase
MGKKIEKISDKCAEEIYDELPDLPEQQTRKQYVFFDTHVKGKEGKDGIGKDGQPNNKGNRYEVGSAEANKIEQEWIKRVDEAKQEAMNRGLAPAGIERFIEGLSKVEINWRTRLRNYITQQIPNDYTWRFPSKKSQAVGIYMPSMTKEKIEIVISIDVSGSIDTIQYTKFISEVVSMARTYRERINMKIFYHDTEITTEYDIHNGNIQKIMAMKIVGGGGTCFDRIVQEMNEKEQYKKTKCLVWFTDGYGDRIETSRKFPILWVLSKNGTDEYIKDNKQDQIIKLKSD